MDRARFKKSDSRGSEASVPLTIQLVQGPLIDEGKRWGTMLVEGSNGLPLLLIDQRVSAEVKEKGIECAMAVVASESGTCREGDAPSDDSTAQTFAHSMARRLMPGNKSAPLAARLENPSNAATTKSTAAAPPRRRGGAVAPIE